jgi:hypothetical protein
VDQPGPGHEYSFATRLPHAAPYQWLSGHITRGALGLADAFRAAEDVKVRALNGLLLAVCAASMSAPFSVGPASSLVVRASNVSCLHRSGGSQLLC